MAYIDKRTFEIYSSITDLKDDSVFECDDAIAPVIRILNLKGYTTTFCCSGHPYPSKVDILMRADSSNRVYDFLSKDFSVKEVTLDDLKNSCYFESATDMINNSTNQSKMHLYLASAIQNIGNESYISFVEGKMPASLPRGWKCDKDDVDVMRHIIKFKSEIDFFRKQITVMKKLIEWAESLPKYE